MSNNIKYTETFHSFQGEGFYTGRSTNWIRLATCNLQCDGFGQKDPTDPNTYVLPYKDFDLSSIDKLEDLPVWDYGCDSSYTWSARYKHLFKNETPSQIVDKLEDNLTHPSNPNGAFLHPLTNQNHHMAFTGGEPMLKQNQKAIVAIMNEFVVRNNIPRFITIETNGTKPLTDDLIDLVDSYQYGYGMFPLGFNGEWFWSISPKLWNTSGEKPEKAICPEVVGQYAALSDKGQLKYVVNGSQQSWDEVEESTRLFREAGCGFDVYIMGVGATKESQEDGTVADIAMEAMRRGYHFSTRGHCSVFGNAIGT
jgi:organic radical activating enzyme